MSTLAHVDTSQSSLKVVGPESTPVQHPPATDVQGGSGGGSPSTESRTPSAGDDDQEESKYSFFTIGRKISLAQIGVVFMALVFASVFFFVSVKRDLEHMLGQRLENIARTATLMVSGDDHEAVVKALTEGGPEAAVKSEAFARITAALKKVQTNNELTSDVYTLVNAESFSALYDEEGKKSLIGNMMFITMVTKGDPYVGNMMPIYNEVKEVLTTSKFAKKPLHTDAEGTWVSAFAPVLNSKGKTVAVLEFDYNAQAEVAEANRQLIVSIVIPGLLGLIMAALLGAYIGKTLSQPIRTLADVAELVAGGNFDVGVDVTTRDETGALGSVFNKMVSDLKRQRLELQDYAQNLEKRIAERTAQLSEANRLIQGMVDSVSQGFFMFDKDGKCLPIYSKACGELLGCSPSGKYAWDALSLKGDSELDFKGWFPLLFEGMMDFAELVPLGPREFKGMNPDHFVTLEYFPVTDDSGLVSFVVVIATDRSAERQADLRAQREKDYAGMILKLIKNRKHFASLIMETRSQFVQLRSELAKTEPDLDVVFRTVHTFKSASAAYSMGNVASTAHEYESELVLQRKQVKDGLLVDFSAWAEKIDHLEQFLDVFLEENKPVIGASGSSGPLVEIPSRELKILLQDLREKAPGSNAIVREVERKYLSESIQNMILHYDEVVSLTATRQQKEVAPLKIEGGEFRVMPEPLTQLMGSMIHAFRNAVDHGLETPDERIESGKSPMGSITVRFDRFEHKNQAWISMKVVDDGRGIDPEVLRVKLEKKGIKVTGETDEQVIQHVFDAGFSTKDQVTDISGRGIGMDAIRASVRDLGGDCRVTSVLGEGTTLVVEFQDPSPLT